METSTSSFLPVKTIPDQCSSVGISEDFILKTDAAEVGLSATLAQGDKNGIIHPIAYSSGTLQQHEKYYAVTDWV